jgi:hypothetical protein
VPHILESTGLSRLRRFPSNWLLAFHLDPGGAVTPEQRAALIRQYADGPAVLEAALRSVPADALEWRPAPGKWTVHEVVVHCADSETNAHMRVRYLLAEPEPLILGYDQDRWAIDLDYHSLPLGPALATVRAVRANTVPLLERLTEAQWNKTGRHTEQGSYGVETWLQIYAEHLDVHARQIGRNLQAWKARK